MTQAEYIKLSTSGSSHVKQYPPPNICTILTRFLILDGTCRQTKWLNTAVLLMSFFYNHFVHELMYTFIYKNNFLHILTLLFLVLRLKKSPIITFLSLGLVNILFTTFNFNNSLNGLKPETPVLTQTEYLSLSLTVSYTQVFFLLQVLVLAVYD